MQQVSPSPVKTQLPGVDSETEIGAEASGFPVIEHGAPAGNQLRPSGLPGDRVKVPYASYS